MSVRVSVRVCVCVYANASVRLEEIDSLSCTVTSWLKTADHCAAAVENEDACAEDPGICNTGTCEDLPAPGEVLCTCDVANGFAGDRCQSKSFPLLRVNLRASLAIKLSCGKTAPVRVPVGIVVGKEAIPIAAWGC